MLSRKQSAIYLQKQRLSQYIVSIICSTAQDAKSASTSKATNINDTSACCIKKTAENGVLLNNLESLAMQNGNSSNNVQIKN